MSADSHSHTVHLRALISGRVQGVSFRANTAKQARRLGLVGVARNLSDGRVEVMAIGASEAVAELSQWLQRGPRFARVDTIGTENLPIPDVLPEEFTTA